MKCPKCNGEVEVLNEVLCHIKCNNCHYEEDYFDTINEGSVDFPCHKCGGKLLVLDEHTNHIQCDTCGYEYDYYGIISEGEYNNGTSTEEN